MGSFGSAMSILEEKGFVEALKQYLQEDRPFFGICLGMQTLFEGSEESPGVKGLGLIKGNVVEFNRYGKKDQKENNNNDNIDGVTLICSVPHIGWNGLIMHQSTKFIESIQPSDLVYFVHSYYAPIEEENKEWVLTTTNYGGHHYISSVRKGNVMATQFHPEKSGKTGLAVLNTFLSTYGKVGLEIESIQASKNGHGITNTTTTTVNSSSKSDITSKSDKDKEEINNSWNIYPTIVDGNGAPFETTNVSKRVIACLDVRSNDAGDLVVTKGDQYDVRESNTTSSTSTSSSDENVNHDTHNINIDDQQDKQNNNSTNIKEKSKGDVRNLGKPVALCERYYQEGADEVVFLNITSFRQGVLEDIPMLAVLEEASKRVFVPLTVGGGIRGYTDEGTKTVYSGLEVAGRYFRAGADKVSIGSDAVLAVEAYFNKNNATCLGDTTIEQISHRYGRQAVVISIDPRRVYCKTNEEIEDAKNSGHTVIDLGENYQQHKNQGSQYCWYQATIKGGREGRPIDAVKLCIGCEALGAGELLVNCVDMDGQCQGYDLKLLQAIKAKVTIPVIASSGAGNPQHFVDVFEQVGVEAGLAAGIFHRKEVQIMDVKSHMKESGLLTRLI